MSLSSGILWKDISLLALMLALFFGIGLGQRPYITPTEARYIEIPREMAVSGDWVTPRLNGVKYFEKPPLFYWIQAAQINAFGLGEFSGRFWTMAFMVGLCVVTYAAGAMLYGRMEGLLAALALSTSALGYVLSRIAQLDVTVSFFLTGCLFSFLAAIRERPGRKRDLLLMAMYACAAFAVLTKGLIGIVLPGLVIGSWILLTGQWHLLREVRLISGAALFLIIALPWHIMAALKTPGFFDFYFVNHQFTRYLTNAHGRFRPWWFFIVVTIVGFFPWAAFLWQALRSGLRNTWTERLQNGSKLYLALWIFLLLGFFSFSHSKLMPYILPIFPPIALLLGSYLAEQWRNGESPGFKRGLLALLIFYALGIIAHFVLHQLHGNIGKLHFALPAQAIPLVFCFVFIALLLSSAWIAEFSTKAIIGLIAASAALVLVVGDQQSEALINRYATDPMKPFAEFLKPRLKPDDEIIMYRHYYHDLPVYLERRMTVAEEKGELEFGTSIEPATQQWNINEDEMWRRWQRRDHTVYIVMRKSIFNAWSHMLVEPVRVLKDDRRNVLISNQ